MTEKICCCCLYKIKSKTAEADLAAVVSESNLETQKKDEKVASIEVR